MDLQQRSEELVRNRFPDQVIGTGAHAGQRWIEIKRDSVVGILTALRDELGFDMLMDLTAVDWLDLGKPERFSVVYVLYSLAHNEYFRVRAWVPEHDPEIDTMGGVWKAAPFAEREVFDMYGLRFRGHEDLKRILLPDHYPGFPLRKDYPLVGNGERYDFPKHTR
ncbi:MAG: NADH-quinone oxidoreductase subunit C [Myxococcota bacterium]